MGGFTTLRIDFSGMGFFFTAAKMVYIEQFRLSHHYKVVLTTSRVLKIAHPLIHLHHNVWLLCEK